MLNTFKIYHRSNYWGREIRGRPTERHRYLPLPVIQTQVVMKNHSEFLGCCYSYGNRVVELKENNFVDYYSGNWSLYLVERKTSKTRGAHYFTFVLMPQVYPPFSLYWKFEGAVQAGAVRMELGRHFYPILVRNEAYGFAHVHVHMIVVMDKFVPPPVDDAWNCYQRPARDRRQRKTTLLSEPSDVYVNRLLSIMKEQEYEERDCHEKRPTREDLRQESREASTSAVTIKSEQPDEHADEYINHLVAKLTVTKSP
jgi:hypothetical protein